MKSIKKIILAAMLPVISLMSGNAFAQKNDKQTEPVNAAQNKKSVEERLVEMAYNKMSVLDSSERIRKDKKDKKKTSSVSIDNPMLKFKISDFRVGDISEIMNLRYRDLVTAPTGEVLAVTTIETKEGNSTEPKISVNTQWQPGQYSSGADLQWTIADIFGIEAVRFHDVGRYASYVVKVTFDGKSRTYRALALFHNRNQPNGNLNPEILDSVSGGGGVLTNVLKDKRLPVGARRQRDAQLPNHLAENAVPERTEKVKYHPGRNGGATESIIWIGGGCAEWDYNPFYYWELYGDPFYSECLVWDLIYPIIEPPIIGGGGEPEQCYAFSTPLSYPQVYESSDQFHTTGGHGARTQFKSVCEQTQGCQTNCDVNVDYGGHWETGETSEYLYYHVGGSTTTRRSGTAPRGVQATCETAMGYSFKRCLIDCGVSVTLGISGQGGSASVTVSGGDLTNYGHIKGRTCLNGQ